MRELAARVVGIESLLLLIEVKPLVGWSVACELESRNRLRSLDPVRFGGGGLEKCMASGVARRAGGVVDAANVGGVDGVVTTRSFSGVMG